MAKNKNIKIFSISDLLMREKLIKLLVLPKVERVPIQMRI